LPRSPFCRGDRDRAPHRHHRERGGRDGPARDRPLERVTRTRPQPHAHPSEDLRSSACRRIDRSSPASLRDRFLSCIVIRWFFASSFSCRARKSQYKVVNGQASGPEAFLGS
jgi:hypothetical protein